MEDKFVNIKEWIDLLSKNEYNHELDILYQNDKFDKILIQLKKLKLT